MNCDQCPVRLLEAAASGALQGEAEGFASESPNPTLCIQTAEGCIGFDDDDGWYMPILQ